MAPSDMSGVFSDAVRVVPAVNELMNDPNNPAYWASRGNEEVYFGNAPISIGIIEKNIRLASLTLQERINMRIDYGTNCASHLVL